MKVLVCGGRNYNDPEAVYKALDDIRPSMIIEGGASGADCYAADWADANNVPLKTFPADWKTYGKSAGPIRNKRMLDKEMPDVVIAFPGGRGTANMVKLAKEAGVRVVEVDK